MIPAHADEKFVAFDSEGSPAGKALSKPILDNCWSKVN
jgi:hypothetical protein